MKAIVRTTITTAVDMADMKVLGHDLHVECDDELTESIVLAISQGAVISSLHRLVEERDPLPLDEQIYNALLEEFGDEADAERATAVVEKFL